MYNCESTIPVVMSFSASVPSGGAGIQADIEALGSMGCHCTPIITCIAAQNTSHLYHLYPCPSRLVLEQAKAVLEDMPVAGFKIGILGSLENILAVHQLLQNYPHIPVVLDPILQGPQAKLNDPALLEAMIALLLPKVTICTPTAAEARLMAPKADTLDACAHEIMGHGADHVLITGHQHEANKIANAFYGNFRRLEVFHWERLTSYFQGAGCTLSASLAGLLAQGLTMNTAVYQAQEYTAECLKQAFRAGMGKHLPNRLFWAREAQYEYDKQQLKPPRGHQ